MFYTLNLEVPEPEWVFFCEPGHCTGARDVASQVRASLALPPTAEVFVASTTLETWGYDAYGLTYYDFDLGVWGHDDAA